MPQPDAREPPRHDAIARAARRLLDGTADPDGRGLALRGEEMLPFRLANLPDGSAMAIAASGLERLARLQDEVGARLRDHPDPAIRRAAALLAVRAHPLLAGLASDAPA